MRCFGALMLFIGLTTQLEAAPGGGGKKPLPTAKLPFEPFTPDEEVLEDAFTEEALPKMAATPLKMTMPPANLPSLGDLGLYAQVARRAEGFAGSLWAAEYPLPWLSVQQSLRFMDNSEKTMLFAERASLNLGIELHPWRRFALSPFLTFEAGGERMQKDEASNPLDLLRLAGQLGFAWRLNRYTAIVGQWSSTYYPSLTSRVYVRDEEPRKQFDHLELAFNLMWEARQDMPR